MKTAILCRGISAHGGTHGTRKKIIGSLNALPVLNIFVYARVHEHVHRKLYLLQIMTKRLMLRKSYRQLKSFR